MESRCKLAAQLPSVDLARLAGFQEAAALIEIMQPDGRMARVPQLRDFCRQHGLKMCTIEDLIKYRRQREKLVRCELAVKLPTVHGDFDLFAGRGSTTGPTDLALCLAGRALLLLAREGLNETKAGIGLDLLSL